MDENSIAARVAKEHRELVGIVDDLRAAAAAVPGREREAWLERLRESFFRFRAHMIHRVALEEIGGFYKHVLECSPTLSKDIEHLQRESRDLLATIEQVHRTLTDADAENPEILQHVRLRIHHVLSAVQHHAEHEDLLVGFFYTQDVGGES